METLHWTAGLHHDGSALYVSNLLPTYGETVQIRLRAPLNAPIRSVLLRTAPDGEHHYESMHVVERDTVSAWWEGRLHVTMPRMTYRFKVMTDRGAYWLTAMGVNRADSPDWFDFKLLADFATPDWLQDAVFYQIFPDRFYNGDPANDVPNGAWSRRGHSTQRREWGASPLHYSQAGTLDFYGGDLAGIAQKLDYLVDLGVNALYLNPIFVAYSNHRYDIADYEHVDPYLGGDEALAELRRALDRAGMRLILDVTPNHCGAQHSWFTAAQADANAPTAEYFTFYHHPHDYESWLGHRSLPKLNYQSERLRDVMYRAPEAVLRRWLREPYRIDGWRLDVANMTARQGATQLAHKVGRDMRRAVKGDNRDAYIFGENFFDGTPHLQGDELDATMNYQGFTIPMWGWLPGRERTANNVTYLDAIPLPAEAMAEQWTRFRAATPWAIARQQFNQLGSHDTQRILNIVNGDKALLKLGVTILMTFPGIPCIYYGDEIGLEGGDDPDNRRCMPWDEAAWDGDLRVHYQRLIRLRRTAPALKCGGFQQVYADDGLIVYQRQSREQRLLIVGYRGPDALTSVDIPVRHAGLADDAILTNLTGSETFTVQNGAIHLEGLEHGAALVLEG
jgi:alpha-glucosidase